MTRPRPPYRHGRRGSSSSRTFHTGSPRSNMQNSEGNNISSENRENSEHHYRERISTEERTRAARLQTTANNLATKACELHHFVRNRRQRNEYWENIKKRITGQRPELLPTGVEIGELLNAVSELNRDEIQTMITAVELYGMDQHSRVNLNRMFVGLCQQRGGARRTRRRGVWRGARHTRRA